jgi:solute carrier family 25 protein 33/36
MIYCDGGDDDDDDGMMDTRVSSSMLTSVLLCANVLMLIPMRPCPHTVGIIPTRAIYFWAYGTTKSYLNTTLGNSPANHLLSAFSAGITSNTITNPLWMVKTRFQIIADTTVGQRKYGSYGEVVQTIMKEEGPLGFFKGITASYIGCFEGAIQWIAYEKFKTLLSVDMTTKEDRTPSPTEYFFAAAGAKFIAVCATYPHEVVRTRLREQATNGLFKYKGFFGTLSTIAKEEGRKGLYGGMGMHLGRSVPNAAVMFVTFELVSSYLNKRSNMQQQTLAVQTSENEEQ